MLSRTKSSYRIWNDVSDDLEAKFLDAIYQGNPAMIEECIEAGINPNLTDDDNLTAMHHAAIRGDIPMARALLTSFRTDVNKTDDDGITPLMYACIYRKENFVKEILDEGADPNMINVKNQTALHMACTSDSLKISVHLIAYGAHINVVDVFDNTPLSIAVIDRASIPLAALLLRKGATATSIKTFPLLLECVLNCNTMHRLKLIKIILYYGADIYCSHPVSKKNCLHYAALTGYFPAAKVLLKRGESNLHFVDLAGRTPLDVAWDHRNIDIYNYYINWVEIKELKAKLEEDIIEHLYKLFDSRT